MDPRCRLVVFDQAGLLEDREMFRYLVLGKLEGINDLADAYVSSAKQDQTKRPKASKVGKGLELRCEFVHACTSQRPSYA